VFTHSLSLRNEVPLIMAKALENNMARAPNPFSSYPTRFAYPFAQPSREEFEHNMIAYYRTTVRSTGIKFLQKKPEGASFT